MIKLIKRLLNSLAPAESSRRFHVIAEDDFGNKIVYRNNQQQFRGRLTKHKQQTLDRQFRAHIRKEYQQLVTDIILIEVIENGTVTYQNEVANEFAVCISETEKATAHTADVTDNNSSITDCQQAGQQLKTPL